MTGVGDWCESFTDWILGITEEIWEKRGLGARMRDWYHKDVIVRMPGGVSVGEPASTRATMETLAQFPDRTLLGEDVIWCGTPEEGMLSSHRILSTATHAGDGAFGPPTGARVTARAIADCWAKDGQIADEWLIRDTGAILRQTGQDPKAWAAARIAAGTAGTPLTPETDVAGPYAGRGNGHAAGERYADLLARLMDADFAAIPEEWDRACHLCYPGGVTGHGWAAADAFWLGLRSAFPSAAFAIHHVIGREDALMPPRAAVRFSLTGAHDGWGAFGEPTGARVHVMGIAHAEFGPWGLRREWVLFDEAAIWTQILMQTG